MRPALSGTTDTTKYRKRLCPSGQGRFFHAVLAQLAEHRSPSQANFSIVGNNVGLHIAEMLFLYKAASSLAIKPAVAGSNPANGAIAAGSAYPAHNRTQTENCVTKPWFYIEKGTPSYEA